LHPLEDGVVRGSAYKYLEAHPNTFTEIYSKNVLEHLPDVGRFFKLCHEALKPGGRLRFETDNAEWPFFYIPHMAWFFPTRTWIGAAVNPAFNKYMNGSPHLYVYTSYHLKVFAGMYGFKIRVLKKVKYGAHLYSEFEKPYV
jgi:2-polyprenyl-3-methyl-5-hydroxy-6-metoxy-1,4-benzoquinol methylase